MVLFIFRLSFFFLHFVQSIPILIPFCFLSFVFSFLYFSFIFFLHLLYMPFYSGPYLLSFTHRLRFSVAFFFFIPLCHYIFISYTIHFSLPAIPEGQDIIIHKQHAAFFQVHMHTCYIIYYNMYCCIYQRYRYAFRQSDTFSRSRFLNIFIFFFTLIKKCHLQYPFHTSFTV